MEDSEESDNRYDRSVEQMEDYTVSTKQSKEETTGMQAADSTDGKAAGCEGGQRKRAPAATIRSYRGTRRDRNSCRTGSTAL